MVAARSEEEIYSTLGLPYIPPELRETGDEIKLAQKGQLPELVTLEDLRGILHAHPSPCGGYLEM